MSGAEVYRAFDAAGRLLYVGCSVDVDARLRQHEQNAVWWPFQVRVDREAFATRAEAAEAEVVAISTEHPRWNIKDRSHDHPDGKTYSIDAAPWLEYERDASRRFRQLVKEEQALLRDIRRTRFALAGVRLEVDAISNDAVEVDEVVA